MHCNLKSQEYFIGGHCHKKLSRIIFRARSKILGNKTQQKWKYADSICIGCKTQVKSGEEILSCEILNNGNRLDTIPITYDWFYRKSVSDIVKVGKLLDKGLKERQRIFETGIT